MTLEPVPALDRLDLLAERTIDSLRRRSGSFSIDRVRVAEIDPDVADTAAMCERYGVLLEDSANCVVIAGRRGDVLKMAACVILATTRADVNGLVRRRLEVRKASFASMDDAVRLTGMEYGGITPFGLPDEWPILVDARVIERDEAIFGSGVRRSKLLAPGKALLDLPNVEVIDGLAVETT